MQLENGGTIETGVLTTNVSKPLVTLTIKDALGKETHTLLNLDELGKLVEYLLREEYLILNINNQIEQEADDDNIPF